MQLMPHRTMKCNASGKRFLERGNLKLHIKDLPLMALYLNQSPSHQSLENRSPDHEAGQFRFAVTQAQLGSLQGSADQRARGRRCEKARRLPQQPDIAGY